MANIYTAILTIIVFLVTGCATSQTQKPFDTSDNRLSGKNDHIQTEILGVREASEGWLEYRVRITNLGTTGISDIRGMVIDSQSNEYNGVTDLTQLEEPPALLAGSLFLGGAVVGTGLLTAGLAIPFLGPALFAGAFVANSQRTGNWEEDLLYYNREAIAGDSIAVNDIAEGSFYFPSVTPEEIRIGYIQNDRREWLAMNESTAKDQLAAPNTSQQNLSESSQTLEAMDLKTAQEILNRLGFEAGPADGIVGQRTKRALREFQVSNGLDATESLDIPTSKALEDAIKE